MTAEPNAPEPVPLVRDQTGRLIVPGSRISLDILVADFKQRMTHQAIHDAYWTVSLADVCAVFAYCLRHRDQVEDHLAEQQREADQVKRRIEAEYPIDEGLRARLWA